MVILEKYGDLYLLVELSLWEFGIKKFLSQFGGDLLDDEAGQDVHDEAA